MAILTLVSASDCFWNRLNVEMKYASFVISIGRLICQFAATYSEVDGRTKLK